ncbi:CoA-acylating methylmalonate-semialdehyde dehydrogenase [Litorimonas sp. RW-G-Af-16]|uniref:CoA-acylating methylmalonate-semialdehyde dehydrogenase n=1 Tax=Litorimonas sp. RW-G-Af-16 TaxID=3241168 RepID=UPI003AB08DB2
MRTIGHFIDGNRVAGTSGRTKDIFNPNTGEVQAKVTMATPTELDSAVASAAKAQLLWAQENPQRRSRIMFAYKQLVEANMDDLAEMLSSEHGKILADSRGDVMRGIDVIEFACGVPHGQKGEHTYGAGPEIDVYSLRKPLGVVAGITPFNFPAMIPMWMFGMAISTGNACILKPSEKDPSVPMRLAELFVEAGGPVGLLQCINGDKEIVDAICDHPTIKAVSFVGSSDIAQYVYARATANGKRAQCMGGAKNHGIIMPDANMEQAAKDILGAAYGSAGERCMALPVVIPVGEGTAERFLEALLPKIEAMTVGTSTDPDADYGPVVTEAHKKSIEADIDKAVAEGATLIKDGRGYILQGYEGGFFVGPTLLDHVTPDMETYHEEIFGPVLQIVRAKNFEEALRLPSEHQYGNGVAIFTQNGRAAREFADRVEVGMVGINVPIPVPVAYHSFGGWKRSAFGDANQYGMEGLRFYTKVKTVTQRWPEGETDDSAFIIPRF